ncbi:MAG: oligosaccharide flippase family protein [Gelidibacter sp.]
MSFKEKLKSILKNNKVIIHNFSYLSILQIFNLLIPLLVYPYLIKTLGMDTFGLVIYAQALISYLVILVGFGFNISGARSISVSRGNKEEVSKIFSSIFFLKLLLLVFAVLVLSVAVFYIPSISQYKSLFFLSLWMCVYDIFFPIWYFQGIEKMKYITYITFATKLFFLILVFLFIKEPSDFLLVPIINGFGSILSGILAFYIIIYRHKVKLFIPKLSDFKNEFNNSIPIFVSNVSIQIYVATNKVIVGAFLGMSSVAYYDLAEKILAVLRTPQLILSQTIFPKISKEKNIIFVKKIFKLSLLLNVLIFFGAFIFADFIVELLMKSDIVIASNVLKILLITIPIVGMSNIFGIQVLVPFGHTTTFSKAILLSGLFYLILMLFIYVVFKFTVYNIACAAVATELFVTTYMFYLSKKLKIW